MHSVTEFEANIPAFLAKLWNMVEDPSSDDLISWGSNGLSFVIKDQSTFAKELLPKYYKHNNMASFIRQLNMYGFHKNLSLESGCAKMEEVVIEFYHACFQKDQPNLLQNIKRKINVARGSGSASNAATVGGQANAVNQVLHDVRKMKSRQDSVDSRLTQMKIENEALWREVSILRQKHIKQQQIVNKLIQFLVSFVQHPHSNGITVKRRNIPLMLQDRSAHSNQLNQNNQSLSGISQMSRSPTGPVIHEIDPNEYAASLLLDDVRVSEGISSPQDASMLVDNPISQESVVDNDETLDTAEAVPTVGDADFESSELLDLPNQLLADGSIPSDDISADSRPELTSSSDEQNEIFTRPNQIRASKRRPRKPAATKKLSNIVVNSPEQADITGLDLDDFPLIIPEELTTVTLPTADVAESTVNLEALSSPIVNLTVGSPDNMQSPLIESPVSVVTTSPYTGDLGEFADPNTVVNSTVPIVPPEKGRFRKIVPKLTTTTEQSPQKPHIKILLPQATKRKSPQSRTRSAGKKSKSSVQTVGKSRMPIGSKTVAATSNMANIPSTTVSNQMAPSDENENNDRTVACMLPSNSQQSMKQEIDSHVDSMQSDLESLKELLKGESISLDANTLLGKLSSSTLSHYLTLNKNEGFDFDHTPDLLFNSEDPFSLTMDLPTQTLDKTKEPDNKIVSYSTPPNTQELSDIFDDYNDWILSPPNEALNEEDVYNIPELNTPDILMTPEPQLASSGKKKKK